MKKAILCILCALAVLLVSCRVPTCVPKAYLGTWEGWYLVSDSLSYTPTVLYSGNEYGKGTITLTLYDDWSFDGVLTEKDYPGEEISGMIDKNKQSCGVDGYWPEPLLSSEDNQIDGTLDILYHNAGYTDIKAMGKIGEMYVSGVMGGYWQNISMYMKVTKK